MGLSKVHNEATNLRNGPTSTKAGTLMYEPPEAEIAHWKPRSRRYDIWSMGCIYLEFAIWLFYGSSGLERFRGELDDHKFYVIQNNTPNRTAQTSRAVRSWSDFIQKDQACPHPLKCLVEFILARLLVVDTDTSSDSEPTSLGDPQAHSVRGSKDVPTVLVRQATELSEYTNGPATPFRASAEEMREKLQKMLKEVKSNRRTTYTMSSRGPPDKLGVSLEPRNEGLGAKRYDPVG